MNHEHKECQHNNIKYCRKCDTAYCNECSKEWNSYVYSYGSGWANTPSTTWGNGGGDIKFITVKSHNHTT